MMRGLVVVVVVGVCACGGAPPPATRPVPASQPGVDSGVWEAALPIDNTPFDDPRRGVDTGLAVTGTTGGDMPELYLRHGLFAWSLLDVKRGHVKITTGDFTCGELFDRGSALAEGIHVDIDPLYTDAAEPQWEDTYLVQNARPAMANGIVQYAGEGSAFPEDAVLVVHSWGERTVEVAFSSSVVSSEVVALTNCGERAPWVE